MISENMFLQNIHFSNVIYKGTAIFFIKQLMEKRLMISIVLRHHSAPSFCTNHERHGLHADVALGEEDEATEGVGGAPRVFGDVVACATATHGASHDGETVVVGGETAAELALALLRRSGSPLR